MKVLRYFLPAAIAALLMSTTGYASIWNSSSSSSSLSLSSDSSDCSSSSQSSSCSSWSSFTTCSCSDSSSSYSSCSSCESSSSVSCSSDSSTSSSSSSYPISISSSSSDEPEQPTCRIRYNNLRDDLIGSFGIKSGCGKDFGVISFNAGGTLVTQDSIDLGQANPPPLQKARKIVLEQATGKKLESTTTGFSTQK